jgi:hypothetical protein
MVSNATCLNSDGQQCHLFKLMVSNAACFNSDDQQCHLFK